MSHRRSVHHHGRLPAAETCLVRGFRPGDQLQSETWSANKRLVSFDNLAAELATGQGRSIVSSFPPDVRKA